jgi:hypothetical protein
MSSDVEIVVASSNIIKPDPSNDGTITRKRAHSGGMTSTQPSKCACCPSPSGILADLVERMEDEQKEQHLLQKQLLQMMELECVAQAQEAAERQKLQTGLLEFLQMRYGQPQPPA